MASTALCRVSVTEHISFSLTIIPAWRNKRKSYIPHKLQQLIRVPVRHLKNVFMCVELEFSLKLKES